MLHRIVGLAVLVTVLTLATACGALALPTQRPVDKVALKVVVLPYLSFGPYFMAQEEGFFAEQGLTIELVQFQRSQDAIPALVQSQLDVLGGGFSFGFLNAITRGANVRIVADKGSYDVKGCAANGLVARKALVDSGELKDVAQLKGRKIAFNPASNGGFVVDTLLKTAGLSLDDVEGVDLAEAALPDAFAKGQVDLAVVVEPALTRVLNGGQAVMWRTSDSIVPGLTYAVVSYGPSLLEKNPSAGERFMVAYLKGLRQYLQGKTDRNMDIMAKYTELDKTLLRQACWPAFSADGSIDVKRVTDFQAWSKARGYLDQVVAEDKVWDGRFIEAARRQLK